MKSIFWIILFCGSSLYSQEFPLSKGDPIPSLTLPSAGAHQPIKTDSFLGKKTLVHVFASW